ncbi:MAG: sialidase family protein [Spirosomataceae bacterium]|jgi:hypothetical protein
MKNIVFFTLATLFFTKGFAQEFVVSDSKNQGFNPSFTKTKNGEILLSFVEKDTAKKVRFYYCKFDGKALGPKNYVPIADSAATHAEGMPRMAVKNDGSMIVTFEIKKFNPASRFGSDLCYVYSQDGIQWSKPIFVNKDRNPAKSSSFSRPVRLADGEIGVIWLDEKLTGKGRSVKFAKTTPGNILGEPVVIDDQACECCRIDAITDTKGTSHIFYRDLYPDGSRDMGYIFTDDSGKTFSKSRNAYPDKWKIDGCPHAGPTATETPEGICISWFTGKENATGIKVVNVMTGKIIKSIVKPTVKAPQLTTNSKGETFWVYTSVKNIDDEYFSTIEFRKLNSKKSEMTLSKDFEICNYPAIITTSDNKVIVAYERIIKNNNQEIVCKISHE